MENLTNENQRLYTLLDVDKKEAKLLKDGVLNYWFKNNEVIYWKELNDVLDNNDFLEIAEKYNKDISYSVSYLADFITVLQYKYHQKLHLEEPIKDPFLLEIQKSTGNAQKFTLGTLSFDIGESLGVPKIIVRDMTHSSNIDGGFRLLDIFTTGLDYVYLKNVLLRYYNDMYMETNDVKIEERPFKYVFGDNEQTPQKYINGLKLLPQRIDLKEKFISFAKKLEHTLDAIENSSGADDMSLVVFGKTRARIIDNLQNSILLIKSENGIETRGLEEAIIKPGEDETAVKQKTLRNSVIKELKEVFSRNKNFSNIEIDPEASLSQTILLLKIIEKENIDLNVQVSFKIRKLGNYGDVTGLEVQFSNGREPILVVDSRLGYSFAHEAGHVVYENHYKNDPELSAYSDILINSLKQKLTMIPEDKKAYYFKPTEIFARATEVAYLLKLVDFPKLVKGKEYSQDKFFTKEMIDTILKSKESDGLIKELEFYLNPQFQGIYFNFKEMSCKELSTLCLYLQDYFGFEQKVPGVLKSIDVDTIQETYLPKEQALVKGIKIDRGNSNPDVYTNLFAPLNKVLEDLRYLSKGKKVEEFNFKPLHSNLLFKLMSNNEDINLYTNSNEFITQLKLLYEGIDVQKQIANIENIALLTSLQNKKANLNEDIEKERARLFEGKTPEEQKLLSSNLSSLRYGYSIKELPEALQDIKAMYFELSDVEKDIKTVKKAIDNSNSYISKQYDGLGKLYTQLNYTLVRDEVMDAYEKQGYKKEDIKKIYDGIKGVLHNHFQNEHFPFNSFNKETALKQTLTMFTPKTSVGGYEITVEPVDSKETFEGVTFKNPMDLERFLKGEIDDAAVLELKTSTGKELFASKNEIFVDEIKSVGEPLNVKQLLSADTLIGQDIYKYFSIVPTSFYSETFKNPNYVNNPDKVGYYQPQPLINHHHLLELMPQLDAKTRQDVALYFKNNGESLVKTLTNGLEAYIQKTVEGLSEDKKEVLLGSMNEMKAMIIDTFKKGTDTLGEMAIELKAPIKEQATFQFDDIK